MKYVAEVLGEIIEVNDNIVKIGDDVFDLSITDKLNKYLAKSFELTGIAYRKRISIKQKINLLLIRNHNKKYYCFISLSDMKYYVEPFGDIDETKLIGNLADNKAIIKSMDNLANSNTYMQKSIPTKSARNSIIDL